MNTTTSTTMAQPNHTHTFCRSRLSSALRTALACAIVGCATLYSPTPLRRRLAFPALSYVTAILIATDATLADALRGAVHAAYGTAFGALPASITLLYLIGRNTKLSVAATSLAVSLSSFVVAVMESTSLITKRVAMGQIVLVYVAAYKQPELALSHPAHVAASTAAGAIAAVLALLFPYPRMACFEVKEKSKQYSDIALERLKSFVKAFCAKTDAQAIGSISHAKSLKATSNKLLQSIKRMQANVQWERLPLLKPQIRDLSRRLEKIEVPLKGMEIALTSITSFPIELLNQELNDRVHNQTNQVSLTLKQHNYTTENYTASKTKAADHSLDFIPHNPQDLAASFFLFCLNKLEEEPPFHPPRPTDAAHEEKVSPATEKTESSCKDEHETTRRRIHLALNLNTEKLVAALKCSLSLGLAILFGIKFSRDYGYWAALSLAITIALRKESTINLANVRIQGTALGSVYGVLISTIPESMMEMRVSALLPWIIFASFLGRSRMYGQAGGIAANISAMIILGRRNYGSPSAFAIGRLTEIFIGLVGSIAIELLFQPTRASTLARKQLHITLPSLNDCIESIAMQNHANTVVTSTLKEQVNKLGRNIEEAEKEPNFWFLPFPAASYDKIHGSLCRMVELVQFAVLGIGFLSQTDLNGDMEAINVDVEEFKNLAGGSMKWLREVIEVKSVKELESVLERRKSSSSEDLEMGGVDECEKVVASFVKHAREVMEKNQVGLGLGTIGFCIGGIVREMKEMEKGIIELVQWETHGKKIDFA